MPRHSRSREFSGSGRWLLLSNACRPASRLKKAGKLCLEMMLSMRRPALTPLPPYPPKPGILAHSISFLTQDPVRHVFTERDELAKRGKLVGIWHTHFAPAGARAGLAI